MLLLMSIGPVQEFIATSRRCQDAWYGSYLLADVAAAAARAIEGRLGAAALIFPAAAHPQAVLAESEIEPRRGSANKVLARTPDERAEAESMANQAAAAVRERLAFLMNRAFSRIGRGDSERRAHFYEDIAREQVEELLEIVWVLVPESNGYAEARRRGEALLSARKSTKLWTQPNWSEAGKPKSSLDGARESVLSEKLFDGRSERLLSAYGVHGSERLCGVGLLKRFGQAIDEDAEWSSARFHSTSHIAALPFLLGANSPESFATYASVIEDEFGHAGRRALRASPTAVPGFGRADGQILFESRLDELADESLASGKSLAAAKSALRTFLKRVDRRPLEPLPYYGMLLADGDRMGLAIDGLTEAERHRELSRALLTFASEVAPSVVESHHGSLIYSGGDDVWAMVPIHELTSCATGLAIEFGRLMETFRIPEPPGHPTLSVGAAIVHHLQPFDQARRTLEAAERRAKQQRNAFALTLDKRGGAPIELVGSWSESPSLDRRLSTWVALHRRNLVPDKAAHELARLSLLGGPDMKEVVEAEAERILARKQPGATSDAELSPEVRRVLGFRTRGPDELGRELLVARLIAQACEQAGTPLGEVSKSVQRGTP
ncbi:MAG: type III-B CRISPR-associated protein Cas10/Cmr2 [Deltaproteobacteria bacterium]|nr:type III-B CRISPR-associated protein Cas10/Cmr2 [Deltaproteobacteria bacterium]